MKVKYLFCLAVLLNLCVLPDVIIAQSTADYIRNPSFEDTPRLGQYYNKGMEKAMRNNIKGWYDCGIISFRDETAPDIHSADTDFWKVSQEPSHGETFLGLAVRDNETWEALSQELTTPLQKGRCYSFTIDLCTAKTFLSPVRSNAEESSSYSDPALFRVWGGDTYCDRGQLLFESSPIDHGEWKNYTIDFQPTNDLKYMVIEAYYTYETGISNGQILVDNISNFTLDECKED